MRSSLRRQMLLLIAFILITILLIGATFYVLLYRFLQQRYETKLNQAAQSVCALITAYSTDYLEDWDFRVSLAVAANASECNILIADSDGVILLDAKEVQHCAHIGKQLTNVDKPDFFTLFSDSSNEAAGELYGTDQLAVAAPVLQADGQRACIVFASLPDSEMVSLTHRTLQIFLVTVGFVLLLMLLLMPILLRRENKLLHEISDAAKSIAHGNFDVRIPISKNNEDMRELAIAFNNMALELKHADDAKQELIANVSHELKTPMTSIAGYMDGMLDGTIPPEKHAGYMELVSVQVRRLSRLVRSMLEVSRLRDVGISPEQVRKFDLCERVALSLFSFETRVELKGVSVDIDMPENGLFVSAMPDSIMQVLQNLLDNAMKFINDGGTLTVRVGKRNGSAFCTIGNTGPTIAPEELPIIFDRFQKADKSRAADRDGVGLGLYIVKTIILAHGEDIYASSRDGVTEFTFTLPLAK